MNWGNTERPRELMPRTVSEPSPPPSQAEAPSTTPGGGDHFGCPFAKRYDPDCDNRHPCAKRAFQTVHRLKYVFFLSTMTTETDPIKGASLSLAQSSLHLPSMPLCIQAKERSRDTLDQRRHMYRAAGTKQG